MHCFSLIVNFIYKYLGFVLFYRHIFFLDFFKWKQNISAKIQDTSLRTIVILSTV